MPLVRSESQGGGDVDRHYHDSEEYRDDIRESRAAMRELLPALNAALPETMVWGLTSHDRLLLMSTPEYDASEPHVMIQHYCKQFHMEYYPPDGDLPIPGAHVGFRGCDVPETVRLIKTAMSASKGWSDSPDL